MQDALGFVPAVFVKKHLNSFVSLQNIAGSSKSIATLQALINAHSTDSSLQAGFREPNL